MVEVNLWVRPKMGGNVHRAKNAKRELAVCRTPPPFLPVPCREAGRRWRIHHSGGKMPKEAVAIDTLWVVVAGCLVLLMHAGFAMLEVGLVRMKHAGAVAAKILANLAYAIVAFWAVGYAIAFGNGNNFLGSTGWFLSLGEGENFQSLAYSAVDEPTKFFFQAMFASIALAIVWGTMLDRTKFGAYLPFALIFVGVIYPIVAHWVWGGGWLFDHGFQDFAGSGVVHVCGASAALAGAIVLGPRIGKFKDGKPVPIPGHSMPLAMLGIFILWVGWMGFNAGSFLSAVGKRLGEVIVVTNLAGAFGVLGAMLMARLLLGTLDMGMMGNGAIAGLGAIAGPCAFVAPWGGAVIGFIAGSVMVPMVLLVDRVRVDDPIGAIAGHGMGGTIGVLSAGFLTTPAAAKELGGHAGLVYGDHSFTQLGWQFVGWISIASFTFGAAYACFWAIKKTIGLRAPESAELAGLDISEHGMFGYPERFIEVVGAEPEEHADSDLAASAPSS
jgi:ammonium transporter, Amt family